MPTRYIPMSEDEQQFAALVERVLTDQKFAKKMQSDPAGALASAGFQLTADQKKALTSSKLTAAEGEHAAAAIAIVRPVVNVLTKGTRPVTQVITKGTQPAVQVVTGTIVAVAPATAAELHEVEGGPSGKPKAAGKRKASGKRKAKPTE